MNKIRIFWLISILMTLNFLIPISTSSGITYCPIWGPNVNMVEATSAVIQYKMKNPDNPWNFTIHEVYFDNLKPNTNYTYSMFDGSTNYTFKTTPTPGDPKSFSFGLYGDNRGSSGTVEVTETYLKIIDEMAKFNPDFVLETGDLIEADGGAYPERREEQWDNYRIARDKVNHETPFYSVVGNHDDPENIAYCTFSDVFAHWGNEYFYSFDYGNSHFTIINTENPVNKITGKQLAWLENDLASTKAAHKFLIGHKPYISRYEPRGLHDISPNEAEVFWEIVENYSITGYLCGHDHYYERVLIGERNISQIISGGAGAALYLPFNNLNTYTTDPYKPYEGKPAFAAYGFSYCIVSVNGDQVRFDVYSLGNYTTRLNEGKLIESYSIPTPYDLADALTVETEYSPLFPSSSDDLIITATIIGSSSPTSVTLFYSKDGINWNNVQMSNKQDTYEYELTELLDDSKIKYYIIAKDSANNRGLSGIQEINIGTPLEIEPKEVYLGPIINSTSCTSISFQPYTQFKRQPSTFPSITSVSSSQAQNSSGFAVISVFISSLMLVIIYKRNKHH